MTRYLNGYVPVAASTGGAVCALLGVAGDMCGCIGPGQGIVTAMTIVYQLFEVFARERENGAAAFMM